MPHMSDMEDETMKFVPKQTVTTGQPTVLYPTVAGVQTEVVDWPAKDPLQYSVLIVPGNPGDISRCFILMYSENLSVSDHTCTWFVLVPFCASRMSVKGSYASST